MQAVNCPRPRTAAVLLGALLILVGGAGAPARAASAPVLAQAPRISIPEREIDFGTVLQGDGVSHDFAFESTGDAPLIIEKVEVNCGCTISEVLVEDQPYELGRQIPPGTKGVIRAHVRTGALHDILNKTMKVRSNDPSGPVELRFRAKIEPFFLMDLDPPTLDFGTVPVGQTKELSLVVRTERVPSFHVVETNELPKGVTVRWDPAEEGKENAWRVTAALGVDAAEGKLDRQILLTTDVNRTIEMYVAGNVSGPVQILPAAALSFGAIQRGTRASRAIEIVVRDGEPPVHVTETKLEVHKKGNEERDLHEYFEVKVATVVDGKRYTVEVVALDTLPRGVFTGVLHLSTDHPAAPRKDVTLSGSAR